MLAESLMKASISPLSDSTCWYDAIWKAPSMNYYDVTDQDTNKVLEIFIRVNSGGQVLTKSDLLLSMATNQWSSEPGARRGSGPGRRVESQGLPLRQGLRVEDCAHVGWRRRAIPGVHRQQDQHFVDRAILQRIRNALLLAADLLRQSGYSSRTLTANNAAAVVAHYLYKRGAEAKYLDVIYGSRQGSRCWLGNSNSAKAGCLARASILSSQNFAGSSTTANQPTGFRLPASKMPWPSKERHSSSTTRRWN